MILLEGNNVWENLRTSFINIDELLLFLKRHEFNGYFYFVFSDCECVLFLHEGDVVNGLEELKEKRRCGQQAVKNILQRSYQNKNGMFSVIQLPAATIDLLSQVYGSSVRALSSDRDSDKTQLISLISRLKKKGFSGYLELQFQSDDKQGIIWFENGKVRAILTEELLADLKEESEAELKFIRSFIEKAQHMGVQFRAYVHE
ncbi:MAG: hypothetical protein JSV83_06855 [Desulfobacterales bacterium]|nr:MAG: hypothetical protein JSV83_06855 [Desulfobacterales bacterium]